MRTRNITQTIRNLVNSVPQSAKKQPQTGGKSVKSDMKNFPKDPTARTNILELKKAQLIADGRRYVDSAEATIAVLKLIL